VVFSADCLKLAELKTIKPIKTIKLKFMRFALPIMAIMAFTLPQFCIGQFSKIEVEEVDNSGLISGATYRVYAVMEDSLDRLDAVMPFEGHPIVIHSSSKFYQHPNGAPIATEIRRVDVENDLALAYDSWVTIDLSDNYLNRAAVHPPGSKFLDNFENSGESIVSYVEDPNGGAWFVRPDEAQGIAGTDKKVLIAQFTTAGTVTGLINLMGRKTTGDAALPNDAHKGLIKEEGIMFTCPANVRGLTREDLLQLSPR